MKEKIQILSVIMAIVFAPALGFTELSANQMAETTFAVR